MDPDPTPDWLASVTRSFDDDPELQLAARQELAERAAAADPDELGELGARFDAVDQGSPGKRAFLHWLPLILAALLILGIGVPTTIYYRSVSQFIRSMQGPASGKFDPMARAASSLTPEDRLFIFGDQTKPTPALAHKALWETQPANPALYADYLAYCDPLPGDLLETAGRIDPDNGWFHLVAAGELGKEAVDKMKRPTPPEGGERPIAGPWDIKDQAKFRQALDLIAEAATKPRIEYYGIQVLKERLERFPPEKDFVSRIPRLVIAASANSKDVFTLLGTARVLSAQAYLLGEAGDREAIAAHVQLGELHCQRLCHQEGNLLSELINVATCITVYGHLIDACEKAGLEDEAARLRPKLDAIRQIRNPGKAWDGEEAMRFKKHGELLSSMAAASVGSLGIPPPTVEDMNPGRFMNYSLMERAFLWANAVQFLILAVLAAVLARFRGKLAARLGSRFSQLPGPVDWLWIVGLGTVLPLAWLLAITRLTPLGCRDWSLVFFSYQPFSAQYTTTGYLIIFATLCAVRWRLGKHAGALGFQARRPRWNLLPVAACALGIPLAGCMRFGPDLIPLYVAAGLLAACSLWTLWLAGRALFGRPIHSPYRAAVLAMLAPSFAIATIVFVAFVPFTHLAERHWIARDEIGRTSPENFGMGRLEADAVRLVQAKLQATLNTPPE